MAIKKAGFILWSVLYIKIMGFFYPRQYAFLNQMTPHKIHKATHCCLDHKSHGYWQLKN